MQRKSLELHQGVGQVQSEISKLQTALAYAEQRLVGELQQFDQTRSELVQLETVALQASQAVMDSIQCSHRLLESDPPMRSLANA